MSKKKQPLTPEQAQEKLRAVLEADKQLAANKGRMGKHGDIVPAPPAAPGSRNRVPPLPLLLSQLQAGLTAADIARIHGCASSSVYDAIRRYGIDITALRTFKGRRADTLAHIQMLVTNAMPGKVEQTSLRDLATTFNILHNAERLERGQSTANVALGDVSGQLSELDATIAKLEAQLGLADTGGSKEPDTPEEP